MYDTLQMSKTAVIHTVDLSFILS